MPQCYYRTGGICVQAPGVTTDAGSVVCAYCAASLPQGLSQKLQERVTRNKVSSLTAPQLQTVIDRQWCSDNLDANGRYACASRQLRFKGVKITYAEREFCNEMATARFTMNRDSAMPHYLPCDTVGNKDKVCWTCREAAEFHSSGRMVLFVNDENPDPDWDERRTLTDVLLNKVNGI